MTAREFLPEKLSKTIAAIFVAASAALIPLLVGRLWLAVSDTGLYYPFVGSALLSLALVLVLLILLPIHFWFRDKFMLRWWVYSGIGTVYALTLQLAVSLFTGGSLYSDVYPSLLASGCCVGWTFWFMVKVERNAIRLAVSLGAALLWWPIFSFWGPVALMPMKIWMGTEVVSQTDLPNGASFQVTQIPAGRPSGDDYSYELGYRDSPSHRFERVYNWVKPPGRSDFEVSEIGDLLTVVTPARDVLLVHKKVGHWHPFLLQKILRKNIPDQPALFALERQDPLVVLTEIISASRIIRMKIEYPGVLPQIATLKLNPRGDHIEMLSVEFPEDPRLRYLREIDFDARSNDVLTIVRDMDNDGIGEFLVSHSDARNEGGGNIWRIYRRSGGKYHRVPGNLSIRTNVISHWSPSGSAATGITTFYPISSTNGVITTYAVVGDKIVESSLNVEADDRSVGSINNVYTQLRIMTISGTKLESILCRSDRNHRRC